MLSLREECESKNEKELARDRFIFPYVFSSSISIFLNGRNRILNYTKNYEFQLPGYCYISRSHYSIGCNNIRTCNNTSSIHFISAYVLLFCKRNFNIRETYTQISSSRPRLLILLYSLLRCIYIYIFVAERRGRKYCKYWIETRARFRHAVVNWRRDGYRARRRVYHFR